MSTEHTCSVDPSVRTDRIRIVGQVVRGAAIAIVVAGILAQLFIIGLLIYSSSLPGERQGHATMAAAMLIVNSLIVVGPGTLIALAFTVRAVVRHNRGDSGIVPVLLFGAAALLPFVIYIVFE